MSMDIEQAKSETKLLIDAGQAVIWSSGSGMGKSSAAIQLYNEIKDRDAAKGIKWGLCIIFGATQTPSDLLGYMFKGEREIITGYDSNGAPETKKITVTDPSIPLWMITTEGLPATAYDHVFLIVDEYGQTEGDSKRAMAEIFLNGGTPPWYLPKGSVRLALTNEGARYGVSKDFDFCIARRSKISIGPSIDAFLKHVDKPYNHQGKQYQVMPVMKAFAANNSAVIFEEEPKEQGPWCTPRQFVAVDRYLQHKFAVSGKRELGSEALEVVAGTIGMPAAVALGGHLTFALSLPQYADVVGDPTGCDVPVKADLQMLMAYELAGHAQPADLAACVTYMGRLPKDMAVTFVSALLRRDYKGFMQLPAMQAWVNKNAALVSVISSLV